MGLSVPAAHVVVFIALASAGTLLAGAVSETVRDTDEARHEALQREQAAVNERIALDSHGYAAEKDRTFANFTNEGSREIPIGSVHVLVEGGLVPSGELAVFQVREGGDSQLWMPGETLEVRADDRGDADVTVVGPHGVRAYRSP